MSTWGDILGGVGVVGGAILSYYVPPLGAAVTALSAAELNNSINQDNMKKTQAYNSPTAQMARFSAAGLNPNLVYGQSGYISPPMPSANFVAPTVESKVNTDNTREMIKTAHTTRALQQSQTGKTDQETSNLGVAFNRDIDTFGADVTHAQLRNDQMTADISKTQADTKFTIDANQRAALMQPALLAKTIADIASTNQITLNAQQTHDINAFAASMSQSGIGAGTPQWMKVVMSFLYNGLGGLKAR